MQEEIAIVLRSRAPVRIDFAGGTTDLKAFRDREGGVVLSGAIARYAYCSLQERSRGLRIDSDDLQEYVEAADIRGVEEETSLQLLRLTQLRVILPPSSLVKTLTHRQLNQRSQRRIQPNPTQSLMRV